MNLPFRAGQIIPNLRMLWRVYGARFPLIIAGRFLEYSYYVLFHGQRTFMLDGRSYRYFYHLHNPTFRVERCVEIPIVLCHVREHVNGGGRGDGILEVGNVLANYTDFKHDVVDKYEVAEGVVNEDIVSFRPQKEYSLVVSISTLEHVGWDETPKDGNKIPAAVANMKRLLKPGGLMVVTVPVGYNSVLDGFLSGNELGFSKTLFLKRVSRDGRWDEAGYDEVRNVKFGAPFPCANAIAIGLYRRPGARSTSAGERMGVRRFRQ